MEVEEKKDNLTFEEAISKLEVIVKELGILQK